MLEFSVREDRCRHCGTCVRDCPYRIIEMKEAEAPFVASANEEKCLECQHCLAVCPSGAISVFGLDPDRSLPVAADLLPRFDQMARFVRSRRSVRRYQDRNVDPGLIRQLLNGAAHAPTGVNRRDLTFTVIDDKDTMQWFRTRAMQELIQAAGAGHIPERFTYLTAAAAAYPRDGTDILLRGAPHALIVSGLPEAPCAAEDVVIALAYFELLAQSAGLGTVWCGMLKLALELIPDLKPLIGVPAGHPYYAMLFGYPAVQYARTVQRDDAAKVLRVKKAQA